MTFLSRFFLAYFIILVAGSLLLNSVAGILQVTFLLDPWAFASIGVASLGLAFLTGEEEPQS